MGLSDICTTVIVTPKFGVSLFSFISDRGYCLSSFEARKIFRQVIVGLFSLQKKGIFHLDVKEENILVDPESLKVKIIDFGKSLSRDLTQKDTAGAASTPKQASIGSQEFCAPEIILPLQPQLNNLYPKNTPKNLPKHDVWSLGVTFWSSLIGELPYKTLTSIINYSSVTKSYYHNLDFYKVDKLALYQGFDRSEAVQVKQILKKMLVLDPNDRIDFEGLLEFRFFESNEISFWRFL